MSNTNNALKPFEPTTHYNRLIHQLKEAAVGQVFTWDELERIAGVNVRSGKGAGYRRNAVGHLRDVYRKHFRTLPGVGLRCGDNNDCFATSDQKREYTRRRHLEELKVLGCVNVESLDDAGKAKHTAAVITAHVYVQMADRASQQSLRARCSAGEPPGVSETLRMLGSIEGPWRSSGGN